MSWRRRLANLHAAWETFKQNVQLRWRDWRRERTLVEKLNDRGWRP